MNRRRVIRHRLPARWPRSSRSRRRRWHSAAAARRRLRRPRRTSPIPMRDGTQLGADVYLPPGQGPFPVLLTITPYGKNGIGTRRGGATGEGYAVVAVDSRGLRASKGKWEPYIHEAQDGYDIQQWVGHQPWCNGNIGMFGTSYPAYTQVAPAQYRSPYVKALMPVSAQSDNYGSVWASDGIVHLAFGPDVGRAAGSDRREQAGSGQPTGTSSPGCCRSSRFPT